MWGVRFGLCFLETLKKKKNIFSLSSVYVVILIMMGDLTLIFLSYYINSTLVEILFFFFLDLGCIFKRMYFNTWDGC